MRGPRALSVAVGVMLAATGSACATPPGGGTVAPSAAPLSWSLVSSPDAPSGLTDLSLTGVACVTAADCWAVGDGKTAGASSQALIEQLSAGAWSIVASPAPPGSTFSELEGVSCTGSGDCWAVGYDVGPGGVASTLIEESTGAAWSIVSSPAQPDGEAGFLNGVTCLAEGCWAAGSVQAAGGESEALIEEETGGGWSIVPTPPAPAGVTSELNAVSCAGASDCWASGDLVDLSGAIQVLTENDAGNGWMVVPSPSAADSEPSSLGSITCVTARDCWAVGEYDDVGGTSHGLVEHDAGSGWSIVSSPTASGAVGDELSAVSCVTAVDCWAVGQTLGANGTSTALIEQYGGDGWTIVASPGGPGSKSNQLWGVDCVGAGGCWAVGSDSGSGQDTGPALIERGR